MKWKIPEPLKVRELGRKLLRTKEEELSNLDLAVGAVLVILMSPIYLLQILRFFFLGFIAYLVMRLTKFLFPNRPAPPEDMIQMFSFIILLILGLGYGGRPWKEQQHKATFETINDRDILFS